MGVDLTLIPEEFSLGSSSPHSHSLLECDRDRAFFAEVSRLSRESGGSIQGALTSFLGKDRDGDPKYGERQDDAYGERLRWVSAHRLGELSANGPRNVAVLAYMRALPPDNRVYLLWH